MFIRFLVNENFNKMILSFFRIISFGTSFQRICVCNNSLKMKFSIKSFFDKCNQIRSFLRIWSHLPKKYLMENFMFRAVEGLARDVALVK